MAFKIELGAKAKDCVTGFEGIVVSRNDHITGCNQYCVIPKSQDGKYGEAQWIDEMRLIHKTPEAMMAAMRLEPVVPAPPRVGGPRPSPALTRQ